MNDTRITLQRLADICAAYGGDPRRWPPAERAAAEALCAGSAEARALLTEAADLDRTLAALPALNVTPQLRARVLAAIPQSLTRATAREVLADLFGWRPALPALAFALLCGIAVGLWLPAGADTDTEDEFAVALATAFQDELEGY